MNKETGIVTRQFPVVGLSFEIIKNSIVLLDEPSKILIYDK
jgi:hypothetical protein